MVQYHGMREAQRTGSQSIVRGERRSRCPPSTGGRGSCGILSRRHRNCRGTHLKNSSGLRWNIQPPSSVKSSCFKALFNWRYTAAASDGLFCHGQKGSPARWKKAWRIHHADAKGNMLYDRPAITLALRGYSFLNLSERTGLRRRWGKAGFTEEAQNSIACVSSRPEHWKAVNHRRQWERLATRMISSFQKKREGHKGPPKV